MAAENVDGGSAAAGTEEASFLGSIINEIIYSPINLGLVVVIAFLVYKIIQNRTEIPHSEVEPKQLPKLRRDFTVQELRQFDGTQEDGRILVAVNSNVYDVTRGKNFYGPGGPYASFAGRDASRNLATFSVTANDKDEYDDLSDLDAMQMDSVREWELQFQEKYDFVGRLLRKGEKHAHYNSSSSEDEEEKEKAAKQAEKDNEEDEKRKRADQPPLYEDWEKYPKKSN